VYILTTFIISVVKSSLHFKVSTLSSLQKQFNPVTDLKKYTLSQKNVQPLTCYNHDTHDPITIISGRSVTEKVRNQTMLCFPTSPI